MVFVSWLDQITVSTLDTFCINFFAFFLLWLFYSEHVLCARMVFCSWGIESNHFYWNERISLILLKRNLLVNCFRLQPARVMFLNFDLLWCAVCPGRVGAKSPQKFEQKIISPNLDLRLKEKNANLYAAFDNSIMGKVIEAMVWTEIYFLQSTNWLQSRYNSVEWESGWSNG